MIQAQNLPPGKTVRNYPIVLPDQEMTEEQQQQAQMAQIAGIVLTAAAGKKVVMDTATNQIVALLRVTDLASEVAVKIFAKQAAFLVRLAIAQARSIAWSGVSSRAAVVGIEMPAAPPSEEDLPSNLRYTRGTDLETAYTRIAEEYKKYREKSVDDPQVQMLIDEFEAQGISPLPRPDNVSDDAIQRVVNGEEEWRKAFRKAEEEALKEQGRKITIFEIDEEDTAEGLREESRRRKAEAEAERKSIEDAAKRAAGETVESDSKSGDKSSDSESGTEGGDSGAGEEEALAGPLITLTPAEIDEVIERLAEHKAEERAERMVSHDVQAASRNMHQAAIQSLPEQKVIGYRRVVHPELSESGRSCGLCIVASTMWYTRRDLLPIHAGCNCETCEIYDLDGVIFDPGEQINMEDLDVFYREAGDTTHGWDLKKQQYEVIDHPEYGPTLKNVSTKKNGENIPFQRKEADNGEV